MLTHHLGKILSLFALVAFLVLGTGLEGSAHQGSVCHQEQADTQSDDCRDLPADHDHSACPCEGTCQLNQCHFSHGGVVAWQASFASYPSALSLGHDGRAAAVYLNPYLGKPLQPPRA
jgi:hypothetical protein